jgi:hypothetical protein
MRTLKCFVALALGSLLGLLSACTRSAPENKTPAPPEKSAVGTQTNAATTNTVPGRKENLPVREPILE